MSYTNKFRHVQNKIVLDIRNLLGKNIFILLNYPFEWRKKI